MKTLIHKGAVYKEVIITVVKKSTSEPRIDQLTSITNMLQSVLDTASKLKAELELEKDTLFQDASAYRDCMSRFDKAMERVVFAKGSFWYCKKYMS